MLGILSPKLLSEVAPPARRGGFYRIKIRHRTKFAASYSIGKLTCVVPNEKQFTGRNPSSCTRRRSIRLSPIVEYSRLQPPVGVWTVLSSIVGGHALTSPTRHRLGEPLPHQLADRNKAAPEATCVFILYHTVRDTCRLTPPFGELSSTSGYVPYYYSPVRHYPPLHATLELPSSKLLYCCNKTACDSEVPNAVWNEGSFDLHA